MKNREFTISIDEDSIPCEYKEDLEGNIAAFFEMQMDIRRGYEFECEDQRLKHWWLSRTYCMI